MLNSFLLRIYGSLLFDLFSPNGTLVNLNAHKHFILVLLNLLLIYNTRVDIVKISRHVQDLTLDKEQILPRFIPIVNFKAFQGNSLVPEVIYIR